MSKQGKQSWVIYVAAAIAVIILIGVLRSCWINNRQPKVELPPQAPITEVVPPVGDVKPPEEQEEPIHEEERLEEPIEQPAKDEETILAPDGNSIEDMSVGDLGIYSVKTNYPKQQPKNKNYTAMITYAKKYAGTPYVFGAKRGQDKSFDCSSYVQWVYQNTFGIKLPADSRSQKLYVQQNGSNRFIDWKKKIKKGDLIFMGAYRGTKKSDYASYKRNVTTITHVGIYIGKDAQGRHLIQHTASAPTGVRTQVMDGTHLEYRIVYTGHAW